MYNLTYSTHINPTFFRHYSCLTAAGCAIYPLVILPNSGYSGPYSRARRCGCGARGGGAGVRGAGAGARVRTRVWVRGVGARGRGVGARGRGADAVRGCGR